MVKTAATWQTQQHEKSSNCAEATDVTIEEKRSKQHSQLPGAFDVGRWTAQWSGTKGRVSTAFADLLRWDIEGASANRCSLTLIH